MLAITAAVSDCQRQREAIRLRERLFQRKFLFPLSVRWSFQSMGFTVAIGRQTLEMVLTRYHHPPFRSSVSS